VANNITATFIIENLSGSFAQHTDHNGVPLSLSGNPASDSEGTPIMRLGSRSPINLRGRVAGPTPSGSADGAYKITIG